MDQGEPQLMNLFRANARMPRQILYYTVVLAMYILTTWLLIGAMTLPHTTITMNEEEHNDLLAEILKVFEMHYPNSNKKLSSIIPKNWAPKKARYLFYLSKVCRETEGKQRICEAANGESIPSGLLAQFGLQMAAVEPDQNFALEWATASNMTLRGVTTDFELGWGCEWTDSRYALYRCANRSPALRPYLHYSEPKVAILCQTNLFVCLHFFTIIMLFTSSRQSGAIGVVETGFFMWILSIAIIITEANRYKKLELLKNHRHLVTHGSYFSLMICATIVRGVHSILALLSWDVNWLRYLDEKNNKEQLKV